MRQRLPLEIGNSACDVSLTTAPCPAESVISDNVTPARAAFIPGARERRASRRGNKPTWLESPECRSRQPPATELVHTGRPACSNLSRRNFVISTALAAAFGFDRRLAISPAFAQKIVRPAAGFHKYKVGDIEVTALYDGIWEKPHDPAFIKNASVEETKEALAKAGQPTEFVSDPADGGRAHHRRQAHHGGLRSRRPMAAHCRRLRQHEGGRHRPGQDQHDPDFAFPSRPHLRADGEGHQQAGLPRCRARRQRRRIQMVDRGRPRREAARGAQGRSASASTRCFRPGRTSSWSRARRRSRRASASSRRPATRRATPPSWSLGQRATDDLERRRPMCRRCSRRIRNGRAPTTRTAPLAVDDPAKPARPRHRREDDGLRRAFPVPRRRRFAKDGAATPSLPDTI